MRSLVVILLAIACCEARPNPEVARVAFGESYILGGQPADIREFPHQLSQRRGTGAAASHSCGASLLSPTRALSAAHCVDGASPAVLSILAGSTDRTGPGVESGVTSYKMHESYGAGAGTFPNDIAIITLASPIDANGDTIAFAVLPADNGDQFVGRVFTLSGWGRTSASNILPIGLQKVDIAAISTADCNQRMSSVSGASVTDNMICFHDSAAQAGSCNGDSGGPANIDGLVGGVTSWGIQSGGACAPSWPSVYTRTSTYLAWINSNL